VKIEQAMSQAEFEKIGIAIGQAANLLPAIDFETAKALNDKLVEAIEMEKQQGHYSENDLARVEAYGELLLAAAEFKAVADRVHALGVPSPDPPLEEVMTPDDRPNILRSADRRPASRGTDRAPRESDSKD
jgi:hypothetical protein